MTPEQLNREIAFTLGPRGRLLRGEREIALAEEIVRLRNILDLIGKLAAQSDGMMGRCE
jgi:hypothetical protein